MVNYNYRLNVRVVLADGGRCGALIGPLPLEIRFDESSQNESGQEGNAEHSVTDDVAVTLQQPSAKQCQNDAEELGWGIQQSWRRHLRFRVGQFRREFETHRKVTRHEEAYQSGRSESGGQVLPELESDGVQNHSGHGQDVNHQRRFPIQCHTLLNFIHIYIHFLFILFTFQFFNFLFIFQFYFIYI